MAITRWATHTRTPAPLGTGTVGELGRRRRRLPRGLVVGLPDHMVRGCGRERVRPTPSRMSPGWRSGRRRSSATTHRNEGPPMRSWSGSRRASGRHVADVGRAEAPCPPQPGLHHARRHPLCPESQQRALEASGCVEAPAPSCGPAERGLAPTHSTVASGLRRGAPPAARAGQIRLLLPEHEESSPNQRACGDDYEKGALAITMPALQLALPQASSRSFAERTSLLLLPVINGNAEHAGDGDTARSFLEVSGAAYCDAASSRTD